MIDEKINRQILLRQRPEGMTTESTWELNQASIPELQDGQLLVRNEYISLDPAMRGWITDMKSYIPPVQIGEVMRAGTIGTVIKTNNHPKFREGDVLTGWGGVQEYMISDGKGLFKVDPNILPLPKYLSILGMPGMTAYFGILNVGKIKEGDIVLISGAAGAVGSVAGQIAKIKGCTVIGLAGSDEKCIRVKKEYGFDACINYKTENIYERIKEVCPKGIDVYFDNVGGQILDIALSQIRRNARIVICGAISQYNSNEVIGPKNYLSLLVNRATMQGMLVLDYADKYTEAGMQMGMWMAEGKLRSDEAIYEGLENFNEHFLRLFNGNKKGKLIIKL